MKLLLVEDHQQTSDYIRQGLGESGHTCDHTDNGLDGLTAALTSHYDVIILDRNLPKMDGLSVLAALRSEANRTPVLILSALGQVEDRVQGLKAGGDDYLAKPFAFSELMARLEVLARRNDKGSGAKTALTVGDLTLDLLGRFATRKDRRIDLLTKEFQLMEYLMRHANQVVTRTMLIEAIWDFNFDPGTNVIDVHISRVRAKIDGKVEIPMLHTVRGAGYSLKG